MKANADVRAIIERLSVATPGGPIAANRAVIDRVFAHDTVEEIVAALKQTENFQGVAGPINFTPQNTLARSNFVILIGTAGHWVLYQSAS